MNARTLNCYSCGAAVSSDAPNCAHCGARLATVACPACFAMMFQGSRFCPVCGSPAVQWDGEPTNQKCPCCRIPMLRGMLRDIPLHECGQCQGLWLTTATFELICRNAEQQSVSLGLATPPATAPLAPIRYRPCPQCGELMHRVNFAHCSAVIVDVCRAHGTWFDLDELHRIVAFIRGGGLERSREKEKRELEEERHRVQTARQAGSLNRVPEFQASPEHDLLSAVVSCAGTLLSEWLKH